MCSSDLGPKSLADQISELAGSDKIDEELEAMKAALKGDEPPAGLSDKPAKEA